MKQHLVMYLTIKIFAVQKKFKKQNDVYGRVSAEASNLILRVEKGHHFVSVMV